MYLLKYGIWPLVGLILSRSQPGLRFEEAEFKVQAFQTLIKPLTKLDALQKVIH